jgi:hypothetical protein
LLLLICQVPQLLLLMLATGRGHILYLLLLLLLLFQEPLLVDQYVKGCLAGVGHVTVAAQLVDDVSGGLLLQVQHLLQVASQLRPQLAHRHAPSND